MPKKNTRTPLAVLLREAIQASGLSLNQLGQRAGIDHSRLSRFVRGERDLTLDSVDKLCQVLGLYLTADPAAPQLAPAEPPAQKPRQKKHQAADLPPAQEKPARRKPPRPRGG
jgi:transcriptional regulator with XRE-family HTH domain